jgi:hypothetical protein
MVKEKSSFFLLILYFYTALSERCSSEISYNFNTFFTNGIDNKILFLHTNTANMIGKNTCNLSNYFFNFTAFIASQLEAVITHKLSLQ